jgi:hypothetical protein
MDPEQQSVLVTRIDADGGRVYGTATVIHAPGGNRVVDFRDADGKPLSLPPGSKFVIDMVALNN